jgi:hypothetical protein
VTGPLWDHAAVRGRAVAAIAAAVVFVVAAPAWGDARIGTAGGASTALADGFRVPRGARLVGGVVPEMVYPTAASGLSSPGWSATMWLDTDAVSAYNRMAAQAASHDMAVVPDPALTPQGSGCAAKPAPRDAGNHLTEVSSVQCAASFQGGGLDVGVQVLVCEQCSPPIASLRMTARETGAARPDGAPSTRPLPDDTPTAKLTARQQRDAARALPDNGEPFTHVVAGADFPTVVPGSTALTPATSWGCGTAELFTVIGLEGDGRAATRALLHEGDPGQAGPRRIGSVKFHDLTSTLYRYGYYTTLVVVRGAAHGTFATVDYCDD